MADTHYVASRVGTIASAHCAASVPNFLALEWHGMVVGPDGAPPDRPLIRDGNKVSEGPGLGVDLNEPVAREYAREGEPNFGE